MHKFLVAALAAVSVTLGSSAAHAGILEVTVFETIAGASQQVASWTQDQNPTPVDYVNNYYTTVPVFGAVGLGGDEAVTWYSGSNGQLGGFTNFNEDFNILAPTSYAFLESSPTFVPGTYHGVAIEPDLTYVEAYYTIAQVAEPLFKPAFSRFSFNSVAVPEPATWAMMLVGMGMIGFTARRRRTVRVTYA